MEVVLEGLAATPLSEWMRTTRWGYAAVNTIHVLGIALLLGAISTLNLRLLGVWRQTPLSVLSPMLVPVAVTGLSLAFISGALLFLADPINYSGLWLFGVKVALITVGVGHALTVQLRHGLSTLPIARQRLAGALSLVVWLGVLIAGRMIAFVEN